MKPVLIIVAIASALAFAGSSAFAQSSGTQRYTNTLTPLLDGAGGKSIGSVAPGMAVTVVGQSGNATHVTLRGFSAQNVPGTVYTTPDNKHIVAATSFTGHATAGPAAGGYTAVTIDGWIATNALVENVQTVWQSASTLYAQKCGSCHALQPANSYSASQWPGIMKTQAGNAALDPGQTALLTVYLQVQSGR